MQSRFVPVGRVATSHGLHGEVSVIELTPVPLDEFVGVTVWFVPPPATGVRSAVIESVRMGPKGPLATLQGVADIGHARMLSGVELRIPETALPTGWEPPPDPVGLAVTDLKRGLVGQVADVIITGANDVWVVRGGPFGEVLVPVIEDVVREIDWEARAVTVELLPGLIDEG